MRLLLHLAGLAVCIPSLLSAQVTWTRTSAPFGARYDDVFFINDSTGWAVNAIGQIINTRDAAATWIVQKSTDDYFRSIEFLDEQVGIVGTLNNVIYRTQNSGETWTDISTAFPPSVVGLCGLHAVDNNTIYGCGNVLEPAFILKSSDKGNTWNYQDLSSKAKYLIDIYFINSDTGFCAGISNLEAKGAVLLKTVNAGATWTEVLTTNTASDTFWKIFRVNENTLVMSIENFGSANCRFARSEDRGLTWTIEPALDEPLYTQMIGFFNDSLGYYGNNTILSTTDGGSTWTETTPDTVFQAFNRFFQRRPGLAYVGSSYVYKVEDSTVVYTGIDLPLPPQEPRQWLSDPFPNPVADKLSFTYGLSFRTRIYLQILDNHGRLVQQLFHGWQQPGTYTISESVLLTPGQYSIVLYTYDGLSRKPFVVAP